MESNAAPGGLGWKVGAERSVGKVPGPAAAVGMTLQGLTVHHEKSFWVCPCQVLNSTGHSGIPELRAEPHHGGSFPKAGPA